jgi:HAMP domain-containing protein
VRERLKERIMKRSVICKSLLLGAALLLATSAFAANEGLLQVAEPVSVSGQNLAAGDYHIRWEGKGPNVELSILQGKKVVATVPARKVDLHSPAFERDAVVIRKNDDGSRSLSEIQIAGKKYALALGAEADTGENATK